MERLGGRVGDSTFFRFVECDGLNLDVIHEVLAGNLAGCVMRRLVSPEIRHEALANFWKESLRQAYGEEDDQAPDDYSVLGAYHYGVDLETYFAAVEHSKPGLDRLFSNTDNFFDSTMGALADHLARTGVNLRVASCGDRTAGRFRVRGWGDFEGYSIAPHDDEVNTRLSYQRDFEIQQIADGRVVAANWCLQNGDGGSLHYWNLQPDDEARRRTDMTDKGYPYDIALLDGVPKLTVPIYEGDLYFFNGSNVHAVTSQEHSDKLRVSLACLMGFIGSDSVVYWA